MRIEDPMWPAVREIARRILREENLTIHAPQSFHARLDGLVLALGDAQPSRTIFPTVTAHDAPLIDIISEGSDEFDDGLIGRMGAIKPTNGVCWVPLEVNDAWNSVIEACGELLAAGYPGCLGCGGPNSEAAWDEQLSREKWSVE